MDSYVPQKRALEPTPETNEHTLYIQNLNDQVHHSTIKHSLYVLYSTYGDVIDVIVKPHDKKMRGQAHVILHSTASARVALRDSQAVDFFGKPLRVSFAHKKSRILIDSDDE